MVKPNEKNNNEQVNQVKTSTSTSTSIVKWKNTVPITKTVMEFVAAFALAGLAIALATQTVTLASLVALPQAHLIAIGIFAYFAVYYALSTYASYQKMSEIAELESEAPKTKELAKEAKKVIEKASEQVKAAGVHAQKAESHAQAAEKTQADTVKAAEDAANKVVTGDAGTLFTNEVQRKAGEVAEAKAGAVITQKVEEAFELAKSTRSLVDQETFKTALLAKADNDTLKILNNLVHDPQKGLAAQALAINTLNTTVCDKTKGLVTKADSMETRLKTAEDTLKGSANKTLAEQITEHGKDITALKGVVGEDGAQKTGVFEKIQGLDTRITSNATNHTALEKAVGKDDNEGLRKEIKGNATDIGTLKGTVGKLDTSVTDKGQPGVAQDLEKLKDRLDKGEFIPVAKLQAQVEGLFPDILTTVLNNIDHVVNPIKTAINTKATV